MTRATKDKMIFIAAGAGVALVDLGAFAAVIAAKRRWDDISIPPLYLQIQTTLIAIFALAAVLTGSLAFFWRGWSIFAPLFERLGQLNERYYSPGFSWCQNSSA